ncbi:MAG TPA: metalloregulator ArsR/SmtB family transcription factor [Patescibacteria group bacterium]|nr:metalloregulator ArsR/SmtB family transcription factor [Patescibacteria group bacterium]
MTQEFSCCNLYKKKAINLSKLSSILKLASEESRLKILCILKDGEHCVCEIIEHLGLSQSLISHHLRDLKNAGIIIDDKRGLNVFYSLTAKGKKITDLIFQIK